MTLLQELTTDYPNFSWHVHVSGHDTRGDVFWLLVFEEKQVLQSLAKRVLEMVYRFVESETAMISGAASELSGSHNARRRRAAMFDPRRASADGEPSANSSRHARFLGGGERQRSLPDPTTASALRDGSLVSSASGAAARPVASSAAPRESLEAGDASREEDAEARAAAAAVAVVDNTMEEEDDDAADSFIRTAVAGQVPVASAAHWTTAAPAAAATGAGSVLAGRGAAATNNRSFSAAAFAAAARASSLSAAVADGGQKEAVHRAVASSFRNSVPRTWRSTPHKAPIVSRQPAEIAPSKDILERVNKLINMGNVRTHLRNLMPVLGKATADALGLNVPLANTKLEWWPREDDRQLWSLRVQLPYEMRRKVDNRTQVDAVARPVTVSLPGLFCQRDKVNTDIRLEHLVVMLQMEEAARVAFEVYLSKSKPKALCGGRRHKAPSLASMGALRAAPRVVASAAELAAR
eukprot:TRINITY_DN1772_c0_g1_i1.p1 TRINITY_DN1772_c0_g1~~TRINITY_DN1772_c0_g1_i1.p1  ORF type:complete len:466 (+),score=74.24 TRINITY_DN1772_c0_g1_i1:567-1964(+)